MLTRSQSAKKNMAVKARRVKEVLVRTNRPRRVTRKEVSYNDDDDEYFVEENSEDDCSEEDVGIYAVNIDFDEASAAWKKNKKIIGNGCYTYVKTSVTTRSKSQKK